MDFWAKSRSARARRASTAWPKCGKEHPMAGSSHSYVCTQARTWSTAPDVALAVDLSILYRLLHVFLAMLQKLRMMFFCMKHYMFYYVVLPPRRLHNPSTLGAGHHLHLTFTHRITSVQNCNQSARTRFVVEKKRGKRYLYCTISFDENLTALSESLTGEKSSDIFASFSS